MMVSIIIPCYCSSCTIESVFHEIQDVFSTSLSDYDYEVVLIDDCSRDSTAEVIKSISNKHDNVTAVCLSRNCGQPSAILCGMSFVRGGLVAVCEDDGQTPLDMLPKMIEKLLSEDFDVVCGKYLFREKRPLHRALGTAANEKMIEVALGKDHDLYLSSFFVTRDWVAHEMKRYSGPFPYIAGLLLRTTSRIGNVEMEHRSRLAGKSGYTIRKLLTLWTNGFTAFSIKPLNLMILLSFLIMVLSLIVLALLARFVAGANAATILIIVEIGLMGCALLLPLTIIGVYVGRTYMIANDMPQYVIRGHQVK